MASWDSKTATVNRYRARWSEDHPAWIYFDCGCCGGVKWGGESPVECPDCVGGWLAVHVPSRTVAAWPGGPLVGWRRSEAEVERLVAEAGDTEQGEP